MPFNIPDYHKSEKFLHIGCEKPRAYFVPFPCEECAKTETRGESLFFKTLSGDWDFKWFPSLNDVRAVAGEEFEADYAAKNGFDLIVSHHPFIFKKLSRITGFEYKNLETLIKNDVSVLSYHTRLDSALGGVNDVLAERLELCNTHGFGGDRDDFGRIGTLSKEMSGKDFALYLKEKLGCDVRCAFNEGKRIKTVAVLGGSGKDFVYEAMMAGADAYVTSEIPHNLFIDAKTRDFGLYDCGHYYTENPVCEKIKMLLCENFAGLEVEIFDIKSPYVTY
jgi:dinuclear metal center YbgI/SA1388 family protein